MPSRVKPLGLPVGSVRALLLLGLAARAVLDLRAGREIAPWLGVAVLLSAAAYFAARAASPKKGVGQGQDAVKPPLGLPAGTIRLLFLGAVGYGAWLYLKDRETDLAKAHVWWILIAFGIGVLTRMLLRLARKPEDPGARFADHLLSLVTLLCVGGLVALGAVQPRPDMGPWVEPLLAAVGVHYFASR